MRFLVLLFGLVLFLGCGDGDRSVSPAGKATTDCSLMDILAGRCADTADPTLDEVPAGYEAPVDSTAAAVTDSTAAAEEVVADPVDSPEAEEEDSTVTAPVDSTVTEEDSSFDIVVEFLPPSRGARDFTLHEKQLIRKAARRWEDKFFHGIPDAYVYENLVGNPVEYRDGYPPVTLPEVVDDIRVYFTSSRKEDTLGLTFYIGAFLPNPDMINSSPVGLIMLNMEMFNMHYRAPSYRFVRRQYLDIFIEDTAAHEIGHVLQGGDEWDDFIIRGTDDSAYFDGPNAIEQFQFLLQQRDLIQQRAIDYSGVMVPVISRWDTKHWYGDVMAENGGEILEGEWYYRYFSFGGDDCCFSRARGAEIMSYASGLSGQHGAISRVTLGALLDLGYPVDMSKAEYYRFARTLIPEKYKP